MPTKPETIAYMKEQLIEAGPVVFRPMFGGYGVYLDEKMFGIVDDDMLFIKKTEPGDKMVGEGHDAPPYPGGKPALCMTAEMLKNADWLCKLVQATVEALPAPKPKKRK